MSQIFSAVADLAPAYVLSFLIHHDRESAERILPPNALSVLAPDIPATITVIAADKKVTVTMTLPDGSQFTGTWNFVRPGAKFKDIHNVKGTLFTRSPKSTFIGPTEFWIQQYPPALLGEETGRTVVEFYANNVITGVFKTDNDNFGAGGNGEWVPFN
ncbi:hypothetical protein JR316_0009853 [Psilocybe cubensis]|uniref:Uncharacterized protein n=2 Tax=Psilocybe cubensis TaxID=181762 RepID=A0A8H7XLT0_PSICU|nr:hypothetical protein JR316_0009853 [Psilocybe cubensis]KAH9477627.1 hypothetical protein JR316_0009853 [Psilocybe cubensis]